MRATTEPAWTDDLLLGGKLRVRQPRMGYRIAVDTLLLAAAVSARSGTTVVDLGAGVGGAALALAHRAPGLRVVAVERDLRLVELLRHNVGVNDLAARLDIVAGDVAALPLRPGSAAIVMTNPPYAEAGTGPRPETAIGRAARHESEVSLQVWLAAAARLVAPGGEVVVVHRADRLDALLRHLGGRITILPLWPHPGRPAKRVLVRARIDRKGGTSLLPGLVLHRAGGHFTAEADAVLRGEATLNWD